MGAGMRQVKDLGPFAAVLMLAPAHTSPPATKYKETIWD